jgi:hypothetical protein
LNQLDGGPDAEFIAHARTDVPMLCDEIAKRDAEIAQLKERIRVLEDVRDTVGEFSLRITELEALLLTQAQEVWEEAAKIAERPRILDALHGISGVTAEAREIAAELRSRIPPSIGGELKTQEHNDAN